MNYPIVLNPFKSLIPSDDEAEEIVKNEYISLFYIEIEGKYEKIKFISETKPKKPEFEGEDVELVDPTKFVPFGLLIFLISTIPILIYSLIKGLINFSREFRTYKRDLQYYAENINAIKANNIRCREINEAKWDEISSLNNIFENDIKNDVEIKKREIFSQNLKSEIAEIEKPLRTSEITKKGISENFFYAKIKESTILDDFEVIINVNLSDYTPDFIFVHKTGIYVDVEIDEPYIGASKEVIHYYDEDSKCFSDEYRNDFFLSGKWIVIRFSEKQIITNPEGCIEYIIAVVNNTLNMQFSSNIDNRNVLSEKVWSRKIADEMAGFDYRKSYLPKGLNALFD